MPAPNTPQLAPLREDLRLRPAGRDHAGAPRGVLEDPAAYAHYELGWLELETIARWPLGTPAAIAAAIACGTTLTASAAQVDATRAFLEANGLLRLSAAQVTRRRILLNQQRWRPGALLAAVLFQRLPLVRPQRFLDAGLPWVAPLFSRGFLAVIALLVLVALTLISREPVRFMASFNAFFGAEGAVGVAIALTLAKLCHELGHAFAAARAGVLVPSMGVSLMLGWPMLYTDTSGAWAVRSRRSRALIAAAGVLAEMALAGLALFVWPFLEEGALRRTMLFAATTMLVLTLAINANPLMRYDGYYILAEATGIDNLQPRAFTALRWLCRRIGAGDRAASPEPLFGRAKFAALAIYGAASGVYRVVIYAGIALVLYHLGLAVLAVPAAAMTLISFLLWPIVKEIAMWFRLAGQRLGWVLGPIRVLVVLALPIGLMALPWHGTLVLPAVYQGAERFNVFAPEPGQMATVKVRAGEPVAAGITMLTLAAPELDAALQQSVLKSQVAELMLNRGLTGERDRGTAAVQADELATLRSETAGYVARRQRLELAPEQAGRIADLASGLNKGVWVDRTTRLAQIVRPAPAKLIAYVNESDLTRLSPGMTGSAWLAGVPGLTYRVRLTSIASTATARLDEPMLATSHDGDIAVRPQADGSLQPELALYKLELRIEPSGAAPLPVIRTRAQIHLNATPVSFGARLWTRVLGLWRREWG